MDGLGMDGLDWQNPGSLCAAPRLASKDGIVAEKANSVFVEAPFERT
jgi:hypothetical protein